MFNRLIRAALSVGAAAVLVAAVTTAGSAHIPANPLVRTTDGLVRGIAIGATDTYLGIPYAAPPVGDLRWRPPVPVTPWTGERAARSYAPHCAQPASAFGTASTSEDCLYLNVFAPAFRPVSLPVIVWIHGGAFDYGESDDFNPAPMVARGVVVVTINYRLGALGFLADSALADPTGAAGNYGLMDQQAALSWVQANIGRFGGDRADVTVAGESAGGLSVLAQLASPGARGLFTRAISQSGTYNMTQVSRTVAETAGDTFASAVGCANTTADCLRALPVQDILAHQTPTGYRPDVDGAVLTETLQAAFASGTFAHVPVILGTNRDEYTLLLAQAQQNHEPPVNSADYTALISYTLGADPTAAATIASRYPLDAYSNPNLALAAVATDSMFACPALATDAALSQYVPTFAYEFADEQAPQRYLPPTTFPYGAAHTAELPYLFDLTAPEPGALTDPQQHLAAQMIDYWTTFAALGLPLAADAPPWLPERLAPGTVLSLVTPQPLRDNTFAVDHQCDFWSRAA